MDLYPFLFLAPFVFGIFFVIIWLGVVLLLSLLSGWSRLAKIYRSRDSFAGEQWHFVSGQLRNFVNYRNCLTVGANADGLYLSILFPFRAGHPPLFIPWSDITVSEEKLFFAKVGRFTFRQAPDMKVTLLLDTAKKVLAKGPLQLAT